MRILILGGTVFIGRHIAESAVARGHRVSIFNRGRHPDPLGTGIERLRGDRHRDLSVLRNRQWDVVVDTSGYVPSAIEATAELLADSVGTYVFVSSLSVYGAVTDPVDEQTPVQVISDADLVTAEALNTDESPTALTYGKYYGSLKARCEAVVSSYYPDSHLIVRPGVVAGPFDYSNRLTYWLERIVRGGAYLAPNHPDTPIRFIDARDLADWTIAGAEAGRTGIDNMPGPAGLTFGILLEEIQRCCSSDARPVWLAEDELFRAGVQPWIDVPLWLPEHLQGILTIGDRNAVADGLEYRSLEATISDTLAWIRSESPSYKMSYGLDETWENELLA